MIVRPGEHPHRRYNALNGDWVLVSPERTDRPWQGQIEESPPEKVPGYDPECYLCPGNRRAGDRRNPAYSGAFVFDNDFGALRPDTRPAKSGASRLLSARGEPGVCRVVCFSPRHDLSLAEMESEDIRRVVDVWAEEYAGLSRLPFVSYVQIFENKGRTMGCSNPHPHGQIWAQRSVPVEPSKETKRMRQYHRTNRRCLLCDYLKVELKEKVRLVCENDGFVAVVPFWAVWPFEILVMSRRHVNNIVALNDGERNTLADIMKQVTVRYDNLFRISFPYSSGIHQAPTDGVRHPEWHIHLHFLPPLLRSATIRKYMVGYEMLGNPQRDTAPESSAERLRKLKPIHYKEALVDGSS